MLYVSTRNKADTYTPHRVLHSEYAPDGGVLLPMQIPVLDHTALAVYAQMGFGEAVASILNLFFGTQLSGWDVDFAVGRQAVELVYCRHKIALSESWHNPAGSHDYFVNQLYCLVTGENISNFVANPWFHTAVNIALIFGMYGKLYRQGICIFDVSVASGDLQLLFAVRYAQRMGLPIQKIVLGCVEGDGIWEFLSYGEYQTYRKTYPSYLEPLLFLELGETEVDRYLQCRKSRLAYRLDTEEQFCANLFPAVVGEYRVKNLTDSLLHGSNCRLDMQTGRAFCAVQDYRAKTGENRTTLLFACNAPGK